MSGNKKQMVAGKVLGAALVLSLVAAPAAFAAGEQAKDLYAGVSLGQAKVKTDDYDLSDKTDTAWRMYGGKQFTQNVGVEFGYRNLGQAKFDAGASNNGEVRADGVDLAVVGTLPVTDAIGITARLGFFRWEANVSVDGGMVASAAGITPTYGVGAKFGISSDTAVRIEWDRMKDVGESVSTGQSDIDMISVGIVLNF
jgi:OOP family OmpA-OmpF porin